MALPFKPTSYQVMNRATYGPEVIHRVKCTVSTTKQLSLAEFEGLKGSILFGQMFSNRQVITLDFAGKSALDLFFRDVFEWLASTTSGFYCFDVNGQNLYFEKDEDAVAFKLTFDREMTLTETLD